MHVEADRAVDGGEEAADGGTGDDQTILLRKYERFARGARDAGMRTSEARSWSRYRLPSRRITFVSPFRICGLLTGNQLHGVSREASGLCRWRLRNQANDDLSHNVHTFIRHNKQEQRRQMYVVKQSDGKDVTLIIPR